MILLTLSKPSVISRSVVPLLRSILLCLTLSTLTACGGIARIYYSEVPAGSFRMAQVVHVPQESVGQELDHTGDTEFHNMLVEGGVPNSQLRDGKIITMIIYPAYSPMGKNNLVVAFCPKEIDVEPGDFVEIRAGQPPEGDKNGVVNVITQIRQKHDEPSGTVRWDPQDERLWVRWIYADWMRKEGWIYRGGLSPAWYKPTQ